VIHQEEARLLDDGQKLLPKLELAANGYDLEPNVFSITSNRDVARLTTAIEGGRACAVRGLVEESQFLLQVAR
jgi:hypothetical protein